MYAASEQLLGLDWVGRVYEPGIHWTIIGALLGARLVGLGEGKVRSWVRYDKRMLGLAFVGDLLFSFGTRLAAGCTTHHFCRRDPRHEHRLLGRAAERDPLCVPGLPIRAPGRVGRLLPTPGDQGDRDPLLLPRYCHPDHHNPGYDPDYNPWRDPARLLMNGILIVFLGVPLVLAVFGDTIQDAVSQIG